VFWERSVTALICLNSLWDAMFALSLTNILGVEAFEMKLTAQFAEYIYLLDTRQACSDKGHLRDPRNV